MADLWKLSCNKQLAGAAFATADLVPMAYARSKSQSSQEAQSPRFPFPHLCTFCRFALICFDLFMFFSDFRAVSEKAPRHGRIAVLSSVF